MKNILLILQLIPTIIDTVHSVENLIPQAGKGTEKLNLVLDLISKSVGDIGPLVPQITAIIASIVGAANAAGSFTKK